MNVQLQDTFKIPYAFFASDADGNAVNPASGDSVLLTSSAPRSVAVVPDATPDPAKYPAGTPSGVNAIQTGFLTGGSTLATGTSISAQMTMANPPAAGQPTPQVVLIDTVAGPEAGGGLALGTQVPQ